MADQSVMHYIVNNRPTSAPHDTEVYDQGIAVLEAPGKDSVQLRGLPNAPDREKHACFTCKEPGHRAKDCPKKLEQQACSNCGEVGHVYRDCPTNECFNCGGHGHLSKQCPSEPAADQGPRCNGCNRLGHVASDCFYPQPIKTRKFRAPKEDASKEDVSKEDVSKDGKDELPPAQTMAPPLDKPSFTTKLFTRKIPHYVSSVSVEMDISYPSDDASITLRGYAHQAASITLTAHNIVNCTILPMKITDKFFTSRVSQEDIKRAASKLALSELGMLLHFRFDLQTEQPNGQPLNSRPLYGLGFFSHQNFGIFDEVIHRARDILKNGGEGTVLHFFTVATESAQERMDTVYKEMQAQYKNDPILLYWKDCRVNPQTGMEISIDKQPKGFKVPPQWAFQNNTQYVTVHYQNLVHELRKAAKQKGFEITDTKIMKVRGGGDRLYYAELRVPEGASYREGAFVDIQFSPYQEQADT